MNKKYLSVIFVSLFCMISSTFAINQVSVEIKGKWLIIWTPNAVTINLGDVSVGSTATYTFTDDFWIKDLRWTPQWHYTTIQCNWLFQQNWDWVITWVMYKATAWTLLWWQPNQTSINADLQIWEGLDITQPKLYFYRVDWWHNGGVLNTYWDRPTIKISIPEWTPTWSYKGKITYTLYDMPFSI